MSERVEFSIFLRDHVTPGLHKMQREGEKAFATIDARAKLSASSTKGMFGAGPALSGIMKGFGGITSAIGLAGGAMAAFTSIKAVGQMAVDAEQTQVAFETMLGSVDKAKRALGDLKQFSAATPFESEEVIKSGRAMLAFGFQVNELLPNLKAVGDVAAGTQIPLTDLANIFGKARVAGRLYAEDINQLTERGVPIIDELAKVFGVSSGSVKKLVEQGNVGFPQLQQAFANMTSEGGRFFNLMDKQSKTVAGRWSTLTDNAKDLGLKIGTGLLPAMGSLVDFGSSLLQNIAPVQRAFGGIMEAIRPLLDSFKSFSQRLGLAGDGAGFAAFMMNNLAKGIQFVTPFIEVLSGVLGQAVEAYGQITQAVTGFINKNEWLQKGLSGFTGAFVNAFRVIGDMAKNVFGGIGNLISGIFSGDLGTIKEGIGKLAKAAAAPLVDLPKAIAKGFTSGEGFQINFGAGTKGVAQAGGLKVGPLVPGSTSGGTTGASASQNSVKAGIAGVEASARNRSFNLTIEKLVDTVEIHSANLQESTGRIKQLITETFIDAVRDAEIAIG